MYLAYYILYLLTIDGSNLVKCFAKTELMRWPGIENLYGALRKTPVFSSDKRWEDFHTRVVEHVCIEFTYLLRFYLIDLTEHPRRRSILHSNYTDAFNCFIGPYSQGDRANFGKTCRFGHNMGKDRSTRWYRQFQEQTKCRRRHE